MIGFASPGALLWLLALAPAAGAAWYAARGRRRADAAFGGTARLRLGRSAWRRPLQLMLLLAALALVAGAVARPQWGSGERELTRLGIDVAITLDISRSMTARDVEPSRAEAAAAGLQEMLDHLRGDRVGLVTFAGEAFPRSPLTLDLDPLGQLIARAQNEAALVAQGTDLGGALQAAANLLDIDDPARTQVIVLISDGEDVAGELEPALDRTGQLGIRVFTVAAGTAEGGAMEPRASAAEDGAEAASSDGPGELSRADLGTLAGIAAISGGNVRGLESIVGLAVEFQRLRQSTFDEGAEEAPIDRFQWFLGAALALLLAQSLLAEGAWRGLSRGRRQRELHAGRIVLGGAGLLLVALLVACGSAVYREVERGNEAYADAEYEDALIAYQDAAAATQTEDGPPPELSYNIGNALHRLDRLEEATVASTAASTAALSAAQDPALFVRSAYAVGSHAFRRGDLEAAREAFVSALLRDPTDRDAKHNLELTLRLLFGDPPETAAQPPDPPDEADPPGEGDEPPEGGGDGSADEGDPTATPDDGAGSGGGEEGDDPPEDGGGEGAPGDEDDPSNAASSGDPSAPQTLEEAQARLSEALLELGDQALTFDQALEILDLVRVANSLESLEPRGAGPSPLPDR